MAHEIIVLEREDRYRGFYNLSTFRLRHSLFGGGLSGPVDRELFHRGACVAVLPYDPLKDEVLLVEQFRIGALGHKTPPWLTEIVAGGIESGETPEAVAHREGMEEAGVRFCRLHRIGEFFTSPGGTSERVTLFVGEVDAPLCEGHHGLPEEQEDIRTKVLSFDQAFEGITTGLIDSIIPAFALHWLALHRNTLRNPR